MDYGRNEHEEFAKRMETEHKQLNKRIKDLEEGFKQLIELAMSVKELTLSVKSMVEEQKKQGERLEKLEEVPADNWRTLKIGFMSAMGGAVATAIASTLIK